MLHDVVVFGGTIKKELHGVPISMHTCGSVSIIMVLSFAALQAAGAPLLVL